MKTKNNHTCVLPTTVDKATKYLFLSNPQPGDIFEYCTIAHTGVLKKRPWCSYGKKFPEVENGKETFKSDYCTGNISVIIFVFTTKWNTLFYVKHYTITLPYKCSIYEYLTLILFLMFFNWTLSFCFILKKQQTTVEFCFIRTFFVNSIRVKMF